MLTRIKSSFLLLPFLVLMFIGKIPFAVAVLLVSFLALWEFFNGFAKIQIKLSMPISIALTLALYALVYVRYFVNGSALLYNDFFGAWISAVIAIGLAMSLMNKNHEILGGIFTALGVLYIPYMLSYLILIERLDRGSRFIWFAIICSWITDIAAYFGGYYFGSKKLAPELSPKKTVEGAVFGVLGSMIFCLIFGLIFVKKHIVACLLLGILGSVVAQLGDLVASAFKRKMGLKDFSSLIPGHGGILDRFDSVIFVAPFVYYFCILFLV